MLCGCAGKKRAELALNEDSADSPLQVRLVRMLGLKNYLLQKFVFRRKPSSYSIRTLKGTPTLYCGTEIYISPINYSCSVHIIERGSHSIPVTKLSPLFRSQDEQLLTIVYAHGNSSDMGDALSFISKFADRFKAEFVVFDYTGYGESLKQEVGEEVICQDLQTLLAWLDAPLSQTVLWGFSLGSFPVVVNSAEYQPAGCILQCPIGSISCMFYEEYATNIKFKQDHFANIDYIANIDSKILMMHSTADQIIPIQQARLLYQKHQSRADPRNMDFIQVEKIKHNSFHRYIAATSHNQLQQEVIQFLSQLSSNLNSSSKSSSAQHLTSKEAQGIYRLTKIRQGITQVTVKDQFQFQEEDFELVQTQQMNTTRLTNSQVKTTWLCCKK